MTQKQYDKHAREVSQALATRSEPVIVGGGLQLYSFAAPDAQWVSRKQRPTMFGDNKHGAHTKDWSAKELIPEDIKSFLDKHVIDILGKDEVGQAFLKELKEKDNSFTKEEIPDEPTPSY